MVYSLTNDKIILYCPYCNKAYNTGLQAFFMAFIISQD
jgi:hypothetical protein